MDYTIHTSNLFYSIKCHLRVVHNGDSRSRSTGDNGTPFWFIKYSFVIQVKENELELERMKDRR